MKFAEFVLWFVSYINLVNGVRLHCDRGFNYPGKTYHKTFEVSYISGSPDGVPVKHILGINGKFPGPTLEVVQYDRLIIKVVNNIQGEEKQNLTIHWHGIQQRGSPFEDGPSQIMQCPIKQGSYQTYSFELDRPGTYWYHSHVFSQYTEGLWGVLIVHNTHEVWCNRYEEEFTITLNDWYHQSAQENEKWHLSTASRGQPPFPDSALLNGIGRYPCSYAPEKICDPSKQFRNVYKLSPDKRYRIRVINVSAFTHFNVTVDDHMFEVIEVDGVDVGHLALKEAFSFGPGQRYSIILYPQGKASAKASRFLFRGTARTNSIFMFRDLAVPNINKHTEAYQNYSEVTAVLDFSLPVGRKLENFQEPYDFNAKTPDPTRPVPMFMDDLELTPYLRNEAPSSIEPSHSFIVEMNFTVDEKGVRHGAFNDTPYRATTGKPLLAKMLLGEEIPKHARPFFIEYMKPVQLVVNNPHRGSHQVHLHGHHFWVIAKGHVDAGKYDPNVHKQYYLGAAMRDTVAIKQNSFVVIRFIADNPGLWTFHCHIDWHNLSGMAINFIEGASVARKTLNITPEAKRVCAEHGVYI